MNKKCTKSEGFTLTEVLAATTIIGVLSAIAIPNYINALSSNKQKEAELSIATLQTAAMAFVEEALVLDPRSAALLDTKGWILALNEDYQAGLGVLRQAYTLDASDPSVQFHIAYTLAQLQRGSEAKALLNKHGTLAKQFREKPNAEALAASL